MSHDFHAPLVEPLVELALEHVYAAYAAGDHNDGEAWTDDDPLLNVGGVETPTGATTVSGASSFSDAHHQPRAPPPPASFLEQELANMNRCEELLECQRQLQHWRNRLDKLKKEHRHYRKLVELRRKAHPLWIHLSKKDRWKKTTILAAMESPVLPPALQTPHFLRECPEHLQEDPDVVRALLERSDFHAGSFWTLPEALCDDLSLVSAAIRQHPPVLDVLLLRLQQERTSGQPRFTVEEKQALEEHYFNALIDIPENGSNAKKKSVAHNLTPLIVWQALESFSMHIRDSGALILKLIRRWPLPTECARFSLLGSSLRNNIHFALAWAEEIRSTPAQQIPAPILRCFSKRLRATPEVVLAFGKIQAESLLHAATAVRRDFATLHPMAIKGDPWITLRHAVSSPAKTQLLHTPHVVEQLLRRACQLDCQYHQQFREANNTSVDHGIASSHISRTQRLYHWLPSELQVTKGVAIWLVRAGCHRLVPPNYTHQRKFWIQAMREWQSDEDQRVPSLISYADLPSRFQQEADLALRALQHESNPQVIGEVLSRFPSWLTDPRALAPLVTYFKDRGYPDNTVLHLVWHVPDRLWGEKELVLQLIKIHVPVLQWVALPLLEDVDVLKSALSLAPSVALEYIPNHVQLQFPDLIAQAIRKTERTKLWDMFNLIDEDLWLNREVALAWAAAGGDYLHDDFDETMEDDAELFLNIAEQNWCDFMFASDRLLRDPDFMKQAVQRNGYVLREARDGLEEDFDLALLAFANKPDLVNHYEWPHVTSADFMFLTAFARQVRDQLRVWYSYQTLVGALDDGHGLSTSPVLQILPHDPETLQAMQSRWAEYAGVPSRERLELLKVVSKSLAVYGF